MNSLSDFHVGDECRYFDYDFAQEFTGPLTADVIRQLSIPCYVTKIDVHCDRPMIGVSVFKGEDRIDHWAWPDRLEIVLRSRSHRRQLAKGGAA